MLRAKLFTILAGTIVLSTIAMLDSAEGNLVRSLSTTSAAQTPTPPKDKDEPLFREYRGVSIGTTVDEVRKKLGKPMGGASNKQEFYSISDGESVLIFYDQEKVVSLAVTYLGMTKNVPTPKMVFGMDVEPKANGSLEKFMRYPSAGILVSYSRTQGETPLITISMQRMQP